jgi:hypothetical protein
VIIIGGIVRNPDMLPSLKHQSFLAFVFIMEIIYDYSSNLEALPSTPSVSRGQDKIVKYNVILFQLTSEEE